MSKAATFDLILLPCPFCGAEAYIHKSEHKGQSYWSIGCETSKCRGHYCFVLAEAGGAEVVLAWNNRSSGTPKKARK